MRLDMKEKQILFVMLIKREELAVHDYTRK